MDFKLPKLYAITDRLLSGLSHADQVTGFCEGGARLIQLREKELAGDDLYHQALSAVSVARQYGATILINDRVDIAMAVSADGVHLGQTDMPALAAREVLGQSAIIGLSTHNQAQLEESHGLPVDYVAFGPVFTTGSKADPDPVVGVNGIAVARQELAKAAVDRPLIAIGGVDLTNARKVLAAGADSVAVIGALSAATPSEIAARTRHFLSHLAGMR